jgi:hypothetical protein
VRQLCGGADFCEQIPRLPADVSNADENTNAAFMILT